MKIYNKIVLEWNEETQHYDKVVYEDSFEYEGELALCIPTGLCCCVDCCLGTNVTVNDCEIDCVSFFGGFGYWNENQNNCGICVDQGYENSACEVSDGGGTPGACCCIDECSSMQFDECDQQCMWYEGYSCNQSQCIGGSDVPLVGACCSPTYHEQYACYEYTEIECIEYGDFEDDWLWHEGWDCDNAAGSWANCNPDESPGPDYGSYTVPQDYSTIQAALNAAGSNDTVYVDQGTYYENIIWPTDKVGLVLKSIHGYESTIIDGSNSNLSIIDMNSNYDTPGQEINGFTLQHGGGTGNIEGGGVDITHSAVYLVNLRIQDCHADMHGGGISLLHSGTSNMTNVHVSDCTSKSGGGIMIYNSDSTHTSHMTGVTVSACYSSEAGGGIYIYNTISILQNVQVYNNEANPNSSVGYGGGIVIQNASAITFQNVHVYNNVALLGGGIFCTNSNITVDDVIPPAALIVRGNSATEQGGGIYIYNSSDMEGKQIIITDNEAGNYGGGIFLGWMAAALGTLEKITMSNNTAGISGGGIYVDVLPTQIVLKNAIMYDNGESAISGPGSFMSYFSNIQDGDTSYGGNIDEDPEFCKDYFDTDPCEYCITAASPSRGAGQAGVDMGYNFDSNSCDGELPVVEDQNVSMTEDVSPLIIYILIYDGHCDYTEQWPEHTFQFYVDVGTTHGTIEYDDNPLFCNYSKEVSYTPNADYTGTDSFTFYFLDLYGFSSNIGTISINVDPVNDPPVLAPIGNQSFDEDQTDAYLVASATDVDNIPENLWFSASSDNPNDVSVSVINFPYGLDIAYTNDWNIVSLPLEVEDSSLSTIYPEGTGGTLYSYNGAYIGEEALDPGKGYWLHFPGAGTTTVTGEPISSLTLSLTAGWNLFSGISEVTNVSGISDPGGIIVSGTVYGFNQTYQNSSVLTPGHGYWINAITDGDITISSGNGGPAGPDAGTAKLLFDFTPNWNGDADITVTVNDGELTDFETFTLTVNPVEDVPTIELPANFTFDEDGSLVVDFAQYQYISDVEDITSDLTLSVEGNINVLVSIDYQTVTFTSPAHWSGEEILTFTVTDTAGQSASDDVLVVVGAVSDAPIIQWIAGQAADHWTLSTPLPINENSAEVGTSSEDANEFPLIAIPPTGYGDEDIQWSLSLPPGLTDSCFGPDCTQYVYSNSVSIFIIPDKNFNTWNREVTSSTPIPITLTVTNVDPDAPASDVSTSATFYVSVEFISTAPEAPYLEVYAGIEPDVTGGDHEFPLCDWWASPPPTEEECTWDESIIFHPTGLDTLLYSEWQANPTAGCGDETFPISPVEVVYDLCIYDPDPYENNPWFDSTGAPALEPALYTYLAIQIVSEDTSEHEENCDNDNDPLWYRNAYNEDTPVSPNLIYPSHPETPYFHVPYFSDGVNDLRLHYKCNDPWANTYGDQFVYTFSYRVVECMAWSGVGGGWGQPWCAKSTTLDWNCDEDDLDCSEENYVTVIVYKTSDGFSNFDWEVLDTVDFFDTSVPGNNTVIVSWDWDFGDGATNCCNDPEPSHTYAQSGWYVVTLITTNSLGIMNTRIQDVEA
jgi:hypothetical protein